MGYFEFDASNARPFAFSARLATAGALQLQQGARQ